jgi:hypothetical protein
MPTNSDDSDAVDPKTRYNRVLSTIDAQSSPVQRPGVTLRTIKVVLCAHSKFSKRGVKASLQSALDNDDVIAYEDKVDQLRFALTDTETVDRLVESYPEIADNDTIQALAGES